MSTRKGDWIQTYTGRQFWPLDPRPDDISAHDIAHALAMKCRFGGHTKFPGHIYSVAQHSILVADLLPKKFQLWGLLHDAAEAYLPDVPRPVKPFLAGFEAIERRIMECVAERFTLEWPMPAAVKVADNIALATERRDVMRATKHEWNLTEQPSLAHVIEPEDPWYVWSRFITLLREHVIVEDFEVAA